MPNLKEFEHPTISGFWAFCEERESIRIKKEAGEAHPWTEDFTLDLYFFCNVRREDDRGTRWYLEQVEGMVMSTGVVGADLLWKTILYRSVNNIKWFENIGGLFGPDEWKKNGKKIWELVLHGDLPSSPAYIVLQGPDGRGRVAHLREQLEYLHENINELTKSINTADNLKDVWKRLQVVPYVGPFIALQIYRDLILIGAIPFDDDDFTYLGPGARQGLELFGFDQYKSQYAALQEMQKKNPPGLELNLGDCEQSICEYRKYVSLKRGGGRHRYYKGIDDSRNPS